MGVNGMEIYEILIRSKIYKSEQTVEELWAILKVHTHQAHKPILIAGPWRNEGGIVCRFKKMQDVDGRRIPDELSIAGELRAVPTMTRSKIDGSRLRFQSKSLRYHDLFWQAVDELSADINIYQVGDDDCETVRHYYLDAGSKP